MHEMPGSQNLYLIAYLIEYPVKQKQLLVSLVAMARFNAVDSASVSQRSLISIPRSAL
jgi:hypothetical protein